MTPAERADLAHANEVRQIVTRERWGRWLSCGCRYPWLHTCGRHNVPSPEPDDWAPSPFGAGGRCGGRCLHIWPGQGNDPDALTRPCPCSQEETG